MNLINRNAKKIALSTLCFLGTALLFAASPKRIVALSPASAEILCSIGAYNQIAARTDFCDYPAEITEKPSVGGFDGKTLSIETIMSYNPDLVYLTRGMHDFLEKPLNQLGVKTFMSEETSVESVVEEILEIGKLTGHKKNAEKVVAEIRVDIAEALKNSDIKTKLYWEVWNAPYMSAGKDSFINSVIALSGRENIFGDVAEAYPMVSEESIIARQPDIILIPASSGVTVDAVKKRDGWEVIPAVVNGKVFIVDDNLFTRPGPRIGKVVKQLSELR